MDLRLAIGALAQRTGLSIRTLHYYDEIGLLKPSERTAHGHRRYTAADVERLQKILSLRSLGWSLQRIRQCLDASGYLLAEVIDLQLAHLREALDEQERLIRRLEWLARYLRDHGTVSTDDLLQTIQMITMFEKYYTPEQLQQLDARAQEVGQARIQEVQQEWQDLFAAVRAEREQGTDPQSERVLQLAAKWQALVDEFTGGDPGIEQSLRNLYANEMPALQQQHGMDPALFAYIRPALQAQADP